MHPSVSHGLDFQAATEIYRRLEPFMPNFPTPVIPKQINGIMDVAETVDVVVLDAYGVLNVGEAAIPGAVEAVAQLRTLGKPVHVLTNDASNSRERISERHRGRGFDFTADDLISSADCLSQVLSRFPDVSRWGVMAPPHWPVERLGLNARLLSDDKEAFDWADGFVFLSCTYWQSAYQAHLEASLSERAKPVVVANPDVTAPLEERFSVEPGAIAEALHREFNVPLALVGKPYPEVFRAVLDLYPELPSDRFLMVGDTPHTDVLGARAAGMKSLLLTQDGYLREQDVTSALEKIGIWPDFTAPRSGSSF